MPPGLLLPAFALVLLANAILIAVAIRSMRRGGASDDEPWTVTRPRRTEPSAPEPPRDSTVARPAQPASPTTGDTTANMAGPAAESADITVGAVPGEPDELEAPAAIDEPAEADAVEPPQPASPRRQKSATTTSRSGGRRRRFSLPPLDEDHEKVNRSIRSFLEAGPSDDAEPTLDPSSATDAESGQPPTTVALVAVSGPDEGDDPASPLGLAIAAVERALRGAARGTDRVDVVATGRYRIVLASTGELAARAYLRRVRTVVEPLLEELDPPRRLVVATATALGEPIDRAGDVAERRLAALLDAARSDDEVRPRAAGT